MKPQTLNSSMLIFWTRHYYAMSAATDQPRSFYHRYYYKLAVECERRGYNLGKILKGKKHATPFTTSPRS